MGHKSGLRPDASSVHQLDLAGSPSLVEPRLQRTIQAQQCVPALAGNRLHPVALLAGRRTRPEVDVDRGVGVDLESLGLAADGRPLLIGLQHGTRLVVIKDDGPEVRHRNVRRKAKPVVAADWINAFLCRERGPLWYDDLQYAGNGAVDRWLATCMQVVGDWPRMERSFAEPGVALPDSFEERRKAVEWAALMAMRDKRVPEGIAAWLKDNPDKVKRIVGNNSFKAAMQAEQGTAAMNQGNYDSAIPHYARAVHLETEPRRKSNYLFFYGCCLWCSKAKRFDEAVEALSESFKLWPADNPQRDRPFVEIAIVYLNRGWAWRALQHLDTDPCGFAAASGHFNYVKGGALKAEGALQEAFACFEKAIALGASELGKAHAFAADCALEMNRAQPNRELSQAGRRHAKQALHLGYSWACEKWCVE